MWTQIIIANSYMELLVKYGAAIIASRTSTPEEVTDLTHTILSMECGIGSTYGANVCSGCPLKYNDICILIHKIDQADSMDRMKAVLDGMGISLGSIQSRILDRVVELCG